MTPQRIVHIDMDGVLVDFESGLNRIPQNVRDQYAGDEDEIPGMFALMDPIPGAIDAFRLISENYETHILSTAPWNNPSAWTDKANWVRHHFGETAGTPAYKRLTISHNKHLLRGDYLIDDRTANGADRFQGEHIHFRTEKFPDWDAVLVHLGLR